MTIQEDNEEYFPRGGQGEEIKKKRNFVFEKKNQLEPKGKKPGRRERKRKAKHSGGILDEPESDVVFERFEPLVYKGLSEGTLAFCSVRDIFEKYVDISMPGRLSARLYIENISKPFFDALNQDSLENSEEDKPSLHRIFRVGQHICCSVLSVKNDGHYMVRVSSNPAHVNNHMTFEMVKPGNVIQMAVQSIEDHGYMMFSGISGLVSFLPQANAVSYVNDICGFKPLAVGQIVWCLVTKSKLSSTSNTVQVTLDFESITKSKLCDEVSIDLLNPGTRVDVSINKVVSQNLLVDISGSDIHGYIEESQLSSMFSKPEDYKIGSLHTATVLYKFPYAKIVALTLKSDPTTISKEEIKHGTIFEDAEIKSIMKRGVCLKLESKGKVYKGMISVRRLGENVDYVTLSTMFPIGNHIKCRVIGFDALEQVYSCTTDDKLLNEKFLSQNDLQIGQLVDVKVESFKKSGVEVSVGAIKGYVPSQHICDVVIQNPLEKITLKSKHKAKVLNIDGTNIIFTMRPTLVKNRSLTNYHMAQVGDGFYGWVNKILPSAITVSFFGGLFTHIKEENLLEHPHKYTLGELVKCYVVEAQGGRLPVFSLLKSVQNMTLTVGNTYTLVVKKISKNGLTCFFMSKGQHFDGFIPLSHFSDFSEFCEAEMKKYEHGAVIDNVLLLSINEKVPLFTLRQSVFNFFQNNPEMHKGFHSLKKNMLLPCSVSQILPDRILVCAPIPGFNGKVPIPSENLLREVRSYSAYEGILASVSQVLVSAVEVSLTCHLSEKQCMKWSIHNLENFLKYIQPLQTYSMGRIIQCKVNNVQGKSLNVSIESTNLKGIIRNTSNTNYKCGQTLTAVVLYHDVKKNLVYLCAENDASFFNPLKGSLLKTVVSGSVLFVNPYFIIALVRDSEGTGNIVFLPVILDPNDSKNVLPIKGIQPFSTCNVTLKSIHEWSGERNLYFWMGKADDFVSKGGESKKRKAEEPETNDLDEEIVSLEVPKKKKKNKKSTNSSVEMTDENTLSEEGVDVEGVVPEQVGKKKKRKQNSECSSETDQIFSVESAVEELINSSLPENEIDKNMKKNSFVVSDTMEVDENPLLSSENGSNVNAEVEKKKKKKKKKKNKKDNLCTQILNEYSDNLDDYPPPAKVLKSEKEVEQNESIPGDELENKKSEKNDWKEQTLPESVDGREIVNSGKKSSLGGSSENVLPVIRDAREIINFRKRLSLGLVRVVENSGEIKIEENNLDDSAKNAESEDKGGTHGLEEVKVKLEEVGGSELEAKGPGIAVQSVPVIENDRELIESMKNKNLYDSSKVLESIPQKRKSTSEAVKLSLENAAGFEWDATASDLAKVTSSTVAHSAPVIENAGEIIEKTNLDGSLNNSECGSMEDKINFEGIRASIEDFEGSELAFLASHRARVFARTFENPEIKDARQIIERRKKKNRDDSTKNSEDAKRRSISEALDVSLQEAGGSQSLVTASSGTVVNPVPVNEVDGRVGVIKDARQIIESRRKKNRDAGSNNSETSALKRKNSSEAVNVSFEDVGGYECETTASDLAEVSGIADPVPVIEDSGTIIESKKKKKHDKQNSESKPVKRNKRSELKLSLEDAAGFEWEATPSDLAKVTSGMVDEEELSQDSDEETVVAKKLTPAEKRAAAYEAERRIREKEEELMIAESNPQSAEHFDRLLTANPNSSKLWIMYMAYHMESTELEKARSVAKRALKHINVRLEEERLNIWIASLNLENVYGTADSFKEVLTEALKYNDDYKVYKRVLDIYADSKKVAELESLVNQLVKKYKTRMDCWVECQSALMKAGLYDKARNYLQRSLEALPTKDYCTLVSRFALIENKYGFSDQAQSLFENLLTSYPKRVDLWFVYVDMLTKSGTPELARNVLERATAQKLPVRKMKSLYQKWVKFEESFGTPDKVQEVKDAAVNYVNNITSALKDL